MIYSDDIEKKCALCIYSEPISGDDENVRCLKKRRTVPAVNDACKKFRYDITKKHIRRPKRSAAVLNPADFRLD